MRTISGFLQIIGLLVIGVLGYWIWFVNWGPNPNDRVAANVGPWMPGPVRDWGCGKLNQRFPSESPAACTAVATVPSTTPTSPDGGGKL